MRIIKRRPMREVVTFVPIGPPRTLLHKEYQDGIVTFKPCGHNQRHTIAWMDMDGEPGPYIMSKMVRCKRCPPEPVRGPDEPLPLWLWAMWALVFLGVAIKVSKCVFGGQK